MKGLMIRTHRGHLMAAVDEANYEWAIQWNWFVDVRSRVTGGRRLRYVCRFAVDGSKRRKLYLHREVVIRSQGSPIPAGMVVDHIDRDGLNNTRSNLRIVNQSHNSVNTILQSGKSGYRGVEWHPTTGKWRARFAPNGVRKDLGLFVDPVDAARAYDSAVRQAYGPLAVVNFPEVLA